MRKMCIPALAATLTLTALVSVPAHAQDVRYTSVSKMNMSGALGTVARMFGAGGESVDTTYVKGAMIRTSSDGTASIMDLENGRIISIDHGEKSYMIMTFDQMAQAMDSVMTQAKADVAQARGADAPAERPEGEVDLDYSLSVEPTGEEQRINGYSAKRYFMTMETEITVTPEGEEAQKAGRIVMFVDMWNSMDVPIIQAMEAFQERAPELAARSRDSMQGMAAVFATNPQLEGAMEEAAKEAGKLEGFTMRSTTYVVLVPPDVKFDRDQVLKGAEQAEERPSTARRALGSLLGGNRNRDRDEAEAPKQSVFMTIISETRDLETTTLSPSLFEPPAGYTEKTFSFPGR